MNRVACPTAIDELLWEGELLPTSTLMPVGRGETEDEAPLARLSKPRGWAVAGPPDELGERAWQPPGAADDFRFWQVQIGCGLQPPRPPRQLTEARLEITLQPHPTDAGGRPPSACCLRPDREEVAEHRTWTFSPALFNLLLPEGGVWQVLPFRTSFESRRVFHVVQSYGVGTSQAGWVFHHHASRPLGGDQWLEVVIAAPRDLVGIWLGLELSATVKDPVWQRIIPFRRSVQVPPDQLGYFVPA